MLEVTTGIDDEHPSRPQHPERFSVKALHVREIISVTVSAFSVIKMVDNLVADHAIDSSIGKPQLGDTPLSDLHVRGIYEPFFGDPLHACIQLQTMQLFDSTAKLGQVTARPAASVQNRLLARGSPRGGQKVEDDGKTDRGSCVVIAARCAVIILVFDSGRRGDLGGLSDRVF